MGLTTVGARCRVRAYGLPVAIGLQKHERARPLSATMRSETRERCRLAQQNQKRKKNKNMSRCEGQTNIGLSRRAEGGRGRAIGQKCKYGTL